MATTGCVLNPKCRCDDCVILGRCVAGSRLIESETTTISVPRDAIRAGMAEALRLADADESVESERHGDESPEEFAVRRILEATEPFIREKARKEIEDRLASDELVGVLGRQFSDIFYFKPEGWQERCREALDAIRADLASQEVER